MKIHSLSVQHHPIMDQLAKRYVWWQPIHWAYQHPLIFLSNVMNLGSWTDIQLLRQIITDDILIAVLKSSPAGQFSQRSWDFWHRKFFIRIRPLPKRRDLQ